MIEEIHSLLHQKFETTNLRLNLHFFKNQNQTNGFEKNKVVKITSEEKKKLKMSSLQKDRLS